MDIGVAHSQQMGFQKKWGCFHYLSWNITNRLNISLFEAVIWQNYDSTGYRGFEYNYLNPVIFYRPVETSLGSPDNILLGQTGKITLGKSIILYEQILLDEFSLSHIRSNDGWWANKFGIQAGIKAYDLLNIENLFIQGELNTARPYTYSHINSLRSYSHYNQALAHPAGANFQEILGIVRYNYDRIFAELKIVRAQYGEDSSDSNWGKNILKPYTTREMEFGNKTLQGVKSDLTDISLTLSYLINPRYMHNFFVSFTKRHYTKTNINSETNFLMFGFRTSMRNNYYDY